MNQHDYLKQILDSMKVSETNITSNEVLEALGITEYNADDLVTDFQNATQYKLEQAKIFKILDAADRSDIWKIYNKAIAPHVQTPTNNPITVIKEATKASIMPTSYAGEFRPLSMAAKELAREADQFFQSKWESAQIDKVNSIAADYAFLHGTSGVLFGWQDSIIDASDAQTFFDSRKKAKIQAKAYHPSNIFPDPAATTVDEMRYLYFAEKKSKSFLQTIPKFSEAFARIENSNQSVTIENPTIPDKGKADSNDIVTFITCYKKVMRLKQDPITGQTMLKPAVDVIYMAGREIITVDKDIQPNLIPFVPLYDEEVPNNFWGVSKCYKVLSMVITLNKLDSTEATTYFRYQSPIEFINASAGINIPEYQKNRNNPNAAFPVNIDPRVVHAYAQPPELPKNLDSFRNYLLQMIQQVSGVDSIYLGRDFGSIQTTGGVQSAVDRATMRDSNRIKLIDNFIQRELEIIIQFFIMLGEEESMYLKNNDNSEIPASQITFNPLDLIQSEDIQVVVSNCAPRSNASYEDAALKILELQMKYLPSEKGYADFITPEELIGYLNIPKDQKKMFLERMHNQMTNLKLEEYTAVMTAIGTLTQGGIPAEQAVLLVAEQMQKTVLGQIPASKPPQPKN